MNNTPRNSSYCCLCLKSKVRKGSGDKVLSAEFQLSAMRQSLQLSLYGYRAQMVEVGMESLAGYRSDLEQSPAPLLGSC